MKTDDDLAKRQPSEAPQNQESKDQAVPLKSLETFVRKPASGATSLESGTPSLRIGNYNLLQLIGEGGMGAVWMADQTEPVKRRVALKLIKTGTDSKPFIARFEAERQALALMDHPSIAKILDGGTTESGQPYFVMELVAGIPITQYCDQHRLSLPERLGLFTQVCNAIQHAHQKGIIHRDLKPANILVGVYDGKPVPKVIDFGLAKALDRQSKLTDKTFFTEFGAVVGTLQYMSPEQANLDAIDIDTRADIYALGVLLYELLTGSTPIEVATLKHLALLKVLESIRDTDPPRPSARLSSSSHQLTAISGNRQIDPARLQSELRGDLDWIVMKALDKDRSRRYESASGFAADIERYLNNQPVVARPPTAAYRLVKHFQKNRNAVIAACAMLLLLIVGLVGTTIGLLKAKYQAEQSGKAKKVALENLSRAERAESETLVRLAELEEITAFQTSQLSGIDVPLMGERLRSTLLSQFKPELTMNGTPNSALEVELADFNRKLDRINFVDVSLSLLETSIFQTAEKAIESRYPDKPLLAASLLHAIGDTLYKLGRFETAEKPLRKELEIRTSLQGKPHVDTLHAMNLLATVLGLQGKGVEAELLFRNVVETSRQTLGRDDPGTLMWTNNFAFFLQTQQRLEEAEPLLEEVLEARRLVLGNDHPETLVSISDMAFLMRELGKLDSAESLGREALDKQRHTLGDKNPNTMISINNLAIFLKDQGKFGEAEPLYREVLELSRLVIGNEHPDTLISMNNFASFLAKVGKLSEAESLHREAVTGFRQAFGSTHPNTLRSINNLAGVLRLVDKLAESESLTREVIDGLVELSSFDRFRREAIVRLASILTETGRNDEAIEWLKGLSSKFELEVNNALSIAYNAKGDKDACRQLVEDLEKQSRKSFKESPNKLVDGLRLAAQISNLIGDFSQSETLARESLELASNSSSLSWELERTRLELGLSLLGLARVEEAKPLVEASHEALVRESARIPIEIRRDILTRASLAKEILSKK